jgi:hypothetical protein
MRKALPIVEAIIAIAGFAAAIVYFAATQELTPRDFIVLSLGAIIGATLASFAATIMWSSRKNQTIEVERNEESRVRSEAIRNESNRRLELLRALPTRREHIRQLRNEMGELKRQDVLGKGHAASQSESAREAAGYGMVQQAYEHEAAANSWHLRIGEIAESLADLESEYEEVLGMSDADYVEKQKFLRDLG